MLFARHQKRGELQGILPQAIDAGFDVAFVNERHINGIELFHQKFLAAKLFFEIQLFKHMLAVSIHYLKAKQPLAKANGTAPVQQQ